MSRSSLAAVGAILPLKDARPRHHHREDVFRHATGCGPGPIHGSKDECPTTSVLAGSVSACQFGHGGGGLSAPPVVHGDLPVMIEDGATLHNLA